MAFKKDVNPQSDIAVTYTTTAGGYTSWSYPETLYRDNVVDTPTWFYVPHQHHEAALTWTETATQP